MDVKRIVEVHVARPNTSSTGMYEFGTGYLIGRDSDGKGLILTAGHVLADSFQGIEVRFRNTTRPPTFLECDLVKDFRPGLDIAVLRMHKAPPGDIHSGEPLFDSSDPPRDKDAEGAGYPQLTNEPRRDAAGLRELTSLQGKFGILAPRESIVSWDAVVKTVKATNGWKGISGAPVFVDKRLAGVIAKHDPAFSTTTLQVVPSCRLLESPDFCKAIHWSDRLDDERRKEIRECIESEIKGLVEEDRKLITKSLAKALFAPGDPRIKHDAESLCAPVAEHLASQQSENQLAECVDQYREMKKKGKTAIAGALHEILKLILPLEIDRSLLAHVWEQVDHRKMVLIYTPVERHQTVDVIMAGIERKPASFEKKLTDVRGKALVCELPAPKKQSPSIMALEILKSLCEGHVLPGSIDDKLPVEKRIERLMQEVEGILDTLNAGETKGRRPFCILKRWETSEDRAIFQEAIKAIDTDRLRLLFVELSKDGESPIRRKESYIFKLLNDWFDNK